MYMPLLNILGAISGVITVLETYFREQKCITAIGTLSNSELHSEMKDWATIISSITSVVKDTMKAYFCYRHTFF